jgi:fimbrial chaperone protein
LPGIFSLEKYNQVSAMKISSGALCKRSSRLAACSFAAMLYASMGLTLAWAGSFSISPMRIYIEPKNRAVAMTVTNDGDEELVMQADLYLWKQKPGGVDELTLTEDIFLAPPIFKVAAKSRQVVRLALISAQPTTVQLSYRVILRELAEARPLKDGAQVQIATAFSIPIFITPPNAKHQLVCDVQRITPTMLKADCENTGNAFVLLRALALYSSANVKLAGSDNSGYILPGIRRSFEIKHSAPIPAGKAKLAVNLDDATQRNFDVTLGE